MYTFDTGSIIKKISFRRLSPRNVEGYEIYGLFHDETYTSGIRREYLFTIENPIVPDPVLTKVELKYNLDATWKLPEDAYLDRDHQFRLFLGPKPGETISVSSMGIAFNRVAKLISLDTVMVTYDPSMYLELEYFQDLIVREIELQENCDISVKPIFTDSYQFGFHNIII